MRKPIEKDIQEVDEQSPVELDFLRFDTLSLPRRRRESPLPSDTKALQYKKYYAR